MFTAPGARYSPMRAMELFKESGRLSIDIFLMEVNGTITLLPIDTISTMHDEITEHGTIDQRERLQSACDDGLIILGEGDEYELVNSVLFDPVLAGVYAQHFYLQIAHPEPYIELLGHKFETMEDFQKIQEFKLECSSEALILPRGVEGLGHRELVQGTNNFEVVKVRKDVLPGISVGKRELWSDYISKCKERKRVLLESKSRSKERSREILFKFRDSYSELVEWRDLQMGYLSEELRETREYLDDRVDAALLAHRGYDETQS